LAKKGQKFQSYSQETKKKAIEQKLSGKTYRQVAEDLGIQDKDRVKVWMRKYKQLGDYGLLDQRGRREEYIDEHRENQKLKRENEMLKKCLEIWIRQVQKTDTKW
jgi:transposase-like protein